MNARCIFGASFDQPLLFLMMLLDGDYRQETGAQRGSQAAQSHPAERG